MTRHHVLARSVWYARLTTALGSVALGAALLTLYLLLRSLTAQHTAMPFWDQFAVLTPQEVWRDLFRRHNEHLIVLPRLGFLLDFALVRGSNVVNIASILVIQAAHAALLAWVMAVGSRSGRPFEPAIFGLTLCFAFSALQHENLAWGFQTQFVGVYALASACFAVVMLGGAGGGPIFLACLLGAAAALTMANGIFVLPVATALALLIGRPRRQVLTLAIAALVVVVAFAAGHAQVEGHASPAQALRQPLHVLIYVATYIGVGPVRVFGLPSPLDGAVLPSFFLGVMGLVAASLVGLRVVLPRREVSPAEGTLVGILGFVLASAVMTALGRFTLGYMQATSSRYATPTLLFWCCLLLWVWLQLMKRGLRAALFASAAITGAALLLAFQQTRFLRGLEVHVAARYGAETALIVGVTDTRAFARVSPEPSVVRAAGDVLRAQGLSIFDAPYADWMNRPLEGTLRLLPAGRCDGRLDDVAMHDEGPGRFATAHGWAWDAQELRHISRVVLVDQAGHIVGYGRGPLRRPDVPGGTGAEVAKQRVGWAGHAAAAPGTTLRAFALVGVDAVCRLQGEARLGP